jgi:hypothetical protein
VPQSPQSPVLDEQSALRYIAALIKNYEPKFELQGSFTPGLFGCADPQYPSVRREWLRGLLQKGLISKEALHVTELIYDLHAEEGHWDREVDSRFNWRVTVQHGDYLIHVMAVDKTFERFRVLLQTKYDLEEGLSSPHIHTPCLRNETVEHLSELKPILDDIYSGLKRQEEERRQQERIDEAVTNEREKWLKLLSDERTKRRQLGYFLAFIAVVFVVGWVINAINKHFHGIPEDIVLTALGAGIGAIVGAFLYLWGVLSVGLKLGLLKDGKPAPLLIPSAGIVFFALWAALAYAAFKGLI